MVIRLKLFRTIISANQLSIYGAVSENCLKSTVAVEQEQGDLAPADSLIKTPALSIEIPAQENLLRKYKKRVERLPQPDPLIKICTDAGFLKTVEVGTLLHDKTY